MKRAIFFVLFLVIYYATFGQNLVVNPGFEIWTKISKPTGWTHVENCLKDSLSVFSEKYSCMQSGGATTTSDLGQTITVVPGTEYMLSLYNRTIITSNGKGSRIWCYWKDAENNSIDDPLTNDILRPSQYFRSEEWQYFSIIVTSPPDAAAFYLEVRTNTNSIAYWDDFVFEESIPTGNYERDESSVSIYPNPSSNYLIISNINKLQHIDILNITGETIYAKAFNGEEIVTIPIERLADGIYFIRIKNSGKLITRKFIKKAN